MIPGEENCLTARKMGLTQAGRAAINDEHERVWACMKHPRFVWQKLMYNLLICEK